MMRGLQTNFIAKPIYSRWQRIKYRFTNLFRTNPIKKNINLNIYIFKPKYFTFSL